jgi:PPOX class probable F420-dependent enzyme
MVAIPQGYETLFERPLYGHLATTRPDGSPQVNPMWFDWDGELLRFTHTTKRQKYRNVTANPNVAMSISDPDNPYRYLEVRGVVEGRSCQIPPGRSTCNSATATAVR